MTVTTNFSTYRSSFRASKFLKALSGTRTLALWATLGLALVGFGSGCSKKDAKPDEQSLPSSIDADISAGSDSDSGKAGGLQTINFPFDSFVLDSLAKAKLGSNADILKSKSSMKIQIEGHCDERGGIQYNIALGEKRAMTVKNYLSELGISGDRMSTLSFGKERPIDPASSEEAWGRNRRANFVVTTN